MRKRSASARSSRTSWILKAQGREPEGSRHHTVVQKTLTLVQNMIDVQTSRPSSVSRRAAPSLYR